MRRSKINLSKAVSFLIVALLVTIVFNTTVQLNQEINTLERTLHEYIPSDYINHPVITISNNTDFEDQGWPGFGNETDPFVIEGLNITTTEVCISIVDVTVYFEIRNCFLSSPIESANSGIRIDNATHCLISDCIIEFHWRGVDLLYSDGSTISNNTAVNNERGFCLSTSDTCTLTNNTASSNTEYNFYLYHSKNCFIANNTMWGNGLVIEGYSQTDWIHSILNNTVNGKPLGYFASEIGTAVDGSQYGQVILANCTSVNVSNGVFHSASIGVQLAYCTDCTLRSNTAVNGSFGFYLVNSIDCALTNNTATSNSYNFYLEVSDNCRLIDNKATNDSYGFRLYWSDSCTLINNTASDNNWAFYLYSSDNCTLVNNSASDSSDGFYLYLSEECALRNNTAVNNLYGFNLLTMSDTLLTNNTANNSSEVDFSLRRSDSCTLSNNTASSNSCNFELYRSESCILTNNTMWGKGLTIYAETQSNWIHTIQNNTVNGKFLGYFASDTGTTVDGSQYGQMILVNCTGITLENGSFDIVSKGCTIVYSSYCTLRNITSSDNYCGVFSVDSSNNTIVNSTISRCEYYGVYFSASTNNTLANNTLNENRYGAYLIFSTGNHLANNTCSENIADGIFITSSSNNSVFDNDLSGNQYGVQITNSHNNTIVNNFVSLNSQTGIDISGDDNLIYLNVIAGNSRNGYDAGAGNQWNSTGVGNYWSDYGGTGVYEIPGPSGSIDYHPAQAPDIAPPTINEVGDIEYEFGTGGQAIIWSPFDEHPSHYVVYCNEIEIESDVWHGGSIYVILDNLDVGVYNYTIIVYDTLGYYVTDTVFVTIVPASTSTTTTTGVTDSTTIDSTTTSTTTTETMFDTGFTFMIVGLFAGIVGVIIIVYFKKTSS